MAKERRREPKGEGFDLGLGNLGGIFKGLESLIELAAKVKAAGGEIKQEGELNLSHLKEGMKGVFGVTIKTVAGGKPVVESFGNIKKTPEGPSIEEEREPITDVFDEQDEIRIYAEMPGVSEKEIRVNLQADILTISAKSANRNYHKEVLLPLKLKAENLFFSYKNGILEVKIKK